MALPGLGNGLAILAMIASVLRMVPRARSGTAAGGLTTTQRISMAFGVAIFGSVQAMVMASGPGPLGYLTGLRVTLLIAAALLALAAVASTSLYRRRPFGSSRSLQSTASTAACAAASGSQIRADGVTRLETDRPYRADHASARHPCTETPGGRYFSSRTAWPLSPCSSAITPRNLPVGKSKATTWSWPTQ
jgi:hypothetical protein